MATTYDIQQVRYEFPIADGTIHVALMFPGGPGLISEAHMDAAVVAFAEVIHANYPQLQRVTKVYESFNTESTPVYQV